MTVRIAILGGPRCGKTTLIQQLYVDLKIRDINVELTLFFHILVHLGLQFLLS